jgi:hypothetical protein
MARITSYFHVDDDFVYVIFISRTKFQIFIPLIYILFGGLKTIFHTQNVTIPTT